ncbi:hypothetical protein ABZP36_030368 [Zizania latifolia]
MCDMMLCFCGIWLHQISSLRCPAVFTIGTASKRSFSSASSNSRSGEHYVHRVFLDPGGKHCIAIMVYPRGADMYYHHAGWLHPKQPPRLRGLLVNAVMWNRQTINDASTKEVIMGIEDGQIFEIAVDEAEKKEKYVKMLFVLSDLQEGIKGLRV